MKNKLKSILEFVLGYGFSIGFIALIVLAIFSIIVIFSFLIMRFFGFKYESIGSIILFFVIVSIIGIPIEIFANSLPKALLSLKKISIKSAKILFVILSSSATIITMNVVDYFMASVSATDSSIVILAFILALVELQIS